MERLELGIALAHQPDRRNEISQGTAADFSWRMVGVGRCPRRYLYPGPTIGSVPYRHFWLLRLR
jgi:hypothetical protein